MTDDRGWRCPGCHEHLTGDGQACFRCTQTCARKRQHQNYGAAKAVLVKMQERSETSVTLQIYPCAVGPHYHIGNATGREARRLLKRAEKRRRKGAVKAEIERREKGGQQWMTSELSSTTTSK